MAQWGCQPVTTALYPSGPRDGEGVMPVPVNAMVQSVGEAEELVDIRRTHRIGALIEA